MSSTILNDIVRDYESIAAAWFTALFPIAQAVFWVLVAIELVWSAVWWTIDREDGLTVVTALLRKVVAVGFFSALLLNGNSWIPAVVSGFRQAGATASSLPDLNPTGVFDQGLALANAILNSVEGLGLLEGLFPSLVAVFTALIVVVAFAIIAAQLLVALVESFIVIGAGILLIGFSGSRWTKFFTERYLSYVASLGVKLFVLYLIMGVGVSIAARWAPVIERGGFSPIPFFYVMGGSLVFLFLTWHIPSVAGSMMAGAVSLSLADALVPGAVATRASGAVVHSGAVLGGLALTAGRRGVDRLRTATMLHTTTSFRNGGGGSTGTGGSSPATPMGPGGTGRQSSAPASRDASSGSSGHAPQAAEERVSVAHQPKAPPSSAATEPERAADRTTPPNSPTPL
jgi:type IV secretion system protein TrbL